MPMLFIVLLRSSQLLFKLLFVWQNLRFQFVINPLKSSGVTWLHFEVFSAIQHMFLISDIRALWRSGLSTKVPKCQKLKMFVS